MFVQSIHFSSSGIFKPEDPRITEESRALWLRSYMEEKWRLMGRDPDNIPDVAMEKFELEMKRSEIVSKYIEAEIWR